MKKTISLLLILFSFSVSAQNLSIYVSDAGNFNLPPWQILKFDANGQNPTVFINYNLNWPQDILFLEDSNHVLVSNFGTGNIAKFDATSGAFLGNFAQGLNGPTRIKIGPDGLLYVLQWNGIGRVKRYKLNGTPMGDFTGVGVKQSIGLDWDADGNLYVSSYKDDLVQKFDTAGADLGAFINAHLVGPTNIWFDANGDLLVADYDGGAVKRFDFTGAYQGVFINGLNNCEGVGFMPNGDILIGNGGTHSVKRYTAAGAYLADIIPNGAGNLINPNAVVLRETPTASISDFDSSRSHLLYPTAGTSFFVVEEHAKDIESISIYNATGQFIKKIERIENPIWVADESAEGWYTFTVHFKDGMAKSEVILVKK